MVQIYITVGVVVVVAALVCYIFIQQTITERKEAKNRLRRALVKRTQGLLHILNVFPDNFLPKDLLVFIYRCITDAYEQLVRLAPEEGNYVDALRLYNAQLESATRQPENTFQDTTNSTTGINELKQNLGVLSRFLQKSAQRGFINDAQHSQYQKLIKDRSVRLTVNIHLLTAEQAMTDQKTNIAVHHYDIAKNLLSQETPPGYQELLQRINMAIAPLHEMDALDDDETQEDSNWSSFEEEAGWKKKNVYD